jgi:RNA polymerase sigma-70 factor (ECF subfamily)
MKDESADQRLVQRMRAGDERAFDEYFRGFLPRLYRFVLPRVGRDPQAAEEVCQEVMARSMRRIDSYRGEASLFTWLCQMGRNAVSDYWRQRKRRDEVEIFVEDDLEIAAALESLEIDPALRPDGVRNREDLLRLVEVALDRLPGAYGDALEWKYIDGLSVAEISTRLGQSALATQSMLARARSAFREAFRVMAGSELEQFESPTARS